MFANSTSWRYDCAVPFLSWRRARCGCRKTTQAPRPHCHASTTKRAARIITTRPAPHMHSAHMFGSARVLYRSRLTWLAARDGWAVLSMCVDSLHRRRAGIFRGAVVLFWLYCRAHWCALRWCALYRHDDSNVDFPLRRTVAGRGGKSNGKLKTTPTRPSRLASRNQPRPVQCPYRHSVLGGCQAKSALRYSNYVY